MTISAEQLLYDAKVYACQIQMDMYKAQIEIKNAEIAAVMHRFYDLETAKQNVVKFRARLQTVEELKAELRERMYSTTVELEDGSRLTISMDANDARTVDPDKVQDIFWNIPCKNGGNTAPRTLRQVQDCKCVVCKTACATILKWRMLR